MSNRAPLVLMVAGAAAVLSGACSAPWSDSHHGPLTRSQAISRLEADGFTNVHAIPGTWTECTPTTMGIVAGHGPHVGRPAYSLMFKDPQAPAGLLLVSMYADSGFAAACVKGGLYTAVHHSEQLNGKAVLGKSVSPSTVVVGQHRANLPGYIAGTTGDYQTFVSSGPFLGLGEAGNRPGSIRTEADLQRATRDLGY